MDGHSVTTPERSVVPIDDLIAADFATACAAVLRFLHARLGFGLWMVTRTNGDDWIVLAAEDHAYDVHEGDLFRWSDTFCARMVEGRGPRVAPASAEVPAYAEAPIGRDLSIAAYVGVPIQTPEGELFGTLCAIDPDPQPDHVAQEQSLIELLAGLLGNILAKQLAHEEEARRAERARLDSEVDPMTGLWNRRGWERLMAAEDERARRYGALPAIAVVDLDELKEINDTHGHSAGDIAIRTAAAALATSKRGSDFVARLGGDEFGLLAVSETTVDPQALARRVSRALASAGVAASVGCARRDPAGGLRAAWHEADRAMYEAKRARKGGLPEQAGP